MMEVHVVGLSHHRAPVEVREKLAVSQEDWNRYANELVEFSKTSNGYMVPEVAVLSTCNRFELYFASPELKKYPAIECVHAFLGQQSGLSREGLEPYLFTHSGEAATQHLFEVSSGLDSLVLGEAQILAQVKACHERCIEKAKPEEEGSVAGCGGKIVTKMLHAGIRTGKIVRTRTKIGKGSVSVSSAAVELMCAKVMRDLQKQVGNVHVCIVGAGKMARLLLIALYSKHPDIQLTLVNRSVDKAQVLLDEVSGRGGSRAVTAPSAEMWDVIRRSDVVFAATASKDPIITKADLHSLERNLMLIDISVPLNIAADCGEADRVVSYTVDDLKKVVQANADKRQKEVLKAKRLISEEVTKYKLWQASQGAVPYLAALKTMAEGIRLTETDKMSKKLNGLDETERAAVDKLTRHIIDQLFRPIYYSMKDEEEIDVKKNKIWALKSMFNLEPEYKRRLLPQGATPARLPPGMRPAQLKA
uniref:Glutamyl-tRNA reductase n=1 Tax=Alexandrium catenella TaxID=2925 RepID=A0A7S1KWJ4_ALECA